MNKYNNKNENNNNNNNNQSTCINKKGNYQLIVRTEAFIHL